MAEAIVIVTRMKEDRLEVLTSKARGPGAVRLPSAPLAKGEHPCEGAMRALDAVLGSDACQAFRKLTTASDRHYFQASPEIADESDLVFTPVAEAKAALSQDDAGVLSSLIG